MSTQISDIEKAHAELLAALENEENFNSEEVLVKIDTILDNARDNGVGKPWEIINFKPECVEKYHRDYYETGYFQYPPREFLSLYIDVHVRGKATIREYYDKKHHQYLTGKKYARPNFYFGMSGYHPLFRAIMQENVDIVRRLLDRGGNPNLIDPKELTYVMMTAKSWSPALKEIFELMILNGFKVERNPKRPYGFGGHHPSFTQNLRSWEKEFNEQREALKEDRFTPETDHLLTVKERSGIDHIPTVIKGLREVIQNTSTQNQVMAYGFQLFGEHLNQSSGLGGTRLGSDLSKAASQYHSDTDFNERIACKATYKLVGREPTEYDCDASNMPKKIVTV